jgi:hypothetical protein
MYQQQPPYGYGQSPYYPQGYQQPYGFTPQMPKRSAIPKVIGILMIVFGSLTLIGALFGVATHGMSHTDEMAFEDAPQVYQAFKDMARFELLNDIIGIIVGAIELVAGVIAVGYKRKAPAFALFYSIFSGLHTLGYAIGMYAILKPALNAAVEASENIPGIRTIVSVTSMFTGFALIVGTVIGLTWPLIAGILMSRKTARDACIN